MVLLMLVAAVCCVVQLAVLGSWARSVRVTTLLLTIAVGVYVCGPLAVLLQLAWTRLVAAVGPWSLYDVVGAAGWTVDPVVEEVVKVLPLVVLAWRWPRTHRQLGYTDHLLMGAALGIGFELLESMLRFGTVRRMATPVDEGYMVFGNLAGTITVPSLGTSLTTWLPDPTTFRELFGDEGSSVQHLVWTALAALGVAWWTRRSDRTRWFGALPLVVASLDHMAYNLRTGTVPTLLRWPADVLETVGAVLPALLVVALLVAVGRDRWVLAGARAALPRLLLPGEAATGLDPRPVVQRALVGRPWSTYAVWRFVLARRAVVLGARDRAGDDATAAGDAGAMPPADDDGALVAALALTRDQVDRATSATAWAAAGRRFRRVPDLRPLRSPAVVLWVLALLPAAVYLVVGAFPATRGLQEAMRGTVGLWLLVLAVLAGGVLVVLQARPLLALVRAGRGGLHEAVLRPSVRLGTGAGSLVSGILVVGAALVLRDGDARLVRNMHVLDALGDALLVLGLALLVASFVMYPPFGVAVLAGTGTVVLVPTLTGAFVTGLVGAGLLAGTGVLLSEAAEGSPGSGSGSGSGSAGDGAAAARQQRLDELAKDPAHGGKVTPGSRAEAEVGLGLEERGLVQGLRRSPHAGEEFLDAAGRAWDVKAFRSRGFDVQAAVRKIRIEMVAGKENVMLDTRHLQPSQIEQLRTAVEAATARGDLPLKVLWWP